MAFTKAQLRSKHKYTAEKTKAFGLRFYPKDMPLYEFIKGKEQPTRYIKELIMADMGITYDDLERMKPKEEQVRQELPETFDWVATNEVCAELNVSRQRVHQLVKSGDLVSRKVGSRLQIRRDSLEEFISSRQ